MRLDIHSISKYQAENIQNSKMEFIIDSAKHLIHIMKPFIKDLIKVFRGSSSDFMGSDFIIFDLILVTIVMMVVVSGCLDDFILNLLKWILNFLKWNLSERWQQEETQKVLRRINNKKGDKVMTMPKATRKDLNSNSTLYQDQEEVKGEPKKVKWKALPDSKPNEGLTSKFHPKFKIQTQDPSQADMNDVE